MGKHKRWARVVALCLSAAMALPLLPAASRAAGTTLAGEPVTVDLTQNFTRSTNLNAGWKFFLGNNPSASAVAFDDSGWETVDLPHDFSISQPFTTAGEAESGFLPGGTGWYRKSLVLPENLAGKTFLLNFDGVYSDAAVYLNGVLVGEHHYGYSPFTLDISAGLICDGETENILAVQAVNNLPSSRWYSGSGLYRDVTLMVLDPVHVDLHGVQVQTENQGGVEIAVDVVNDGAAPVEVTVTNTILDAGGIAVAQGESRGVISAGAAATVTGSAGVDSPTLWSLDNPYLYTLTTTVTVDGTVTDTAQTTFGFREFSFDSQGFHLNGENIKLNGVCMHHDQGALGAAAEEDAMYRQLVILKDMGVNAVRTAHNPADADFIRLCNELGILVVEELFDGLLDPKNGNTNDFSRYFDEPLGDSGLYGGGSTMTWAEFSAKSVVKRDRNAPSVILWSLGNEIQEGTYWTSVGQYAAVAQQIIDWVNEMDGTRPTTSGDNNRGGDSRLAAVVDTITDNGGIAGFNYANTASDLYSLAQRFGGSTGAIIAAETSSAVNSRSVYQSQANAANADGQYHLTSYDTSHVGWGITAHDSIYNTYQYDCVAGEFVWTGFDYIGEPTPWNGTGAGSVSYAGAIPNSAYFGAVETTGFPKDTYYLYRSQWNQNATTLHLVTAWDPDNMMTVSDGKTPVWIYSNAPVVKLYLNGVQIATATRQDHTSAAGHTYYTYTTASLNTDLCQAVASTGADSLYAAFNVAYASGTLSAKAFAADGVTEIPVDGGQSTVSTPDSPARLSLTQDKAEAEAGELVYITVDVTDAAGNLDTTAANDIAFTLTGDGEILGVDNGDQATTEKYQQASVLFSGSSARIAAYAGKALVIVRATKAGSGFTLTASASGLTGGSVTVATKAAETEGDGLTSYTMVRDYTVKAGTAPTFQTAATGALAGGETVEGAIRWETVPEAVYGQAGDYTVSGSLTFPGMAAIPVTARLHVIAHVVAMRNVSTATQQGVAPDLPDTVRGILADGTLSGDFPVTWDEGQQFAEVGEVVTVTGTATVFGQETMPVTASVRVALAENTQSANVAPTAAALTQDIPAQYQSDNLESIRNGVQKPGDNTQERWTNWNNRYNSSTATLTFRWDTAQLLSGVNIYYYIDSCSNVPESIQFRYSLNGTEYETVAFTDETLETYNLGEAHCYTFAQPVNPVALEVVFTQQDGTTGNHCVGVTELEVMTFAGSLQYGSSADLSGIWVDGQPLAEFSPDVLDYAASGEVVTAEPADNAGITVLPVLDNVVRIVTVSEDGTAGKLYAVSLTPACAHANTALRNARAATCTQDGYTGDTYCLDCGRLLSAGTAIPATGHSTRLVNNSPASCTQDGYTGDWVCTVCGETVQRGQVIPATGHSWDGGVVTEEPTETAEGQMTYTCTVCGATKTEPIAPTGQEKQLPTVVIHSVEQSARYIGRIAVNAQVINPDGYPIEEHGLVYMPSFKLWGRVLSVNLPGRSKVTFTGFSDDAGNYTYHLRPASVYTDYVVRAFVSYRDSNGKLVYVYSDPIEVCYLDLR